MGRRLRPGTQVIQSYQWWAYKKGNIFRLRDVMSESRISVSVGSFVACEHEFLTIK